MFDTYFQLLFNVATSINTAIKINRYFLLPHSPCDLNKQKPGNCRLFQSYSEYGAM